MENKVVLHVMGMDSSKYGGMEHFNVKLAETLSAKGYKGVFIYETEPASQAFVDDMKAAGGEIVILNSRRKPLRFCRELAKLLDEYKPVLVHAHFTKARFYAIPVARFKGIRRLFITIHGEMIPKRQIKLHTRLWCAWSNKVAKIIAVSDRIVSVYKSNWPESEIRRIYLGVGEVAGNREQCRARFGVPEGQILLLTISNFNHIKGLDVLCKAVQILKNKGLMDNACLCIVGQPEEHKAELSPLIEALGIADCVRMEGISNEVPAYLAAADIYIQSSRTEGLPLAMMEAASAALPMVGTKVGGIPEIAREGFNGLLVESENAEMLAEAIASLLCDENMRRQYGQNSLKVYREEFSVESGVSQTIAYYEL